MAKKPNDTQTYELKQKGKVVYKGTTNDLERREAEHKKEGKKFTKMTPTSRKMTEDGAKKKEAKELGTYRKNQGKNPKYNKDSDG
jgi:predicted GIY-YIG superfamily endonuclease